MIKRRWTGLPLWADLFFQLWCYWEYNILEPLVRVLAQPNRRWQLMDKLCKCDKCVARRAAGL